MGYRLTLVSSKGTYAAIHHGGTRAEGAKMPKNCHEKFIEGSPFGPYSGRDSAQGGKKKKK